MQKAWVKEDVKNTVAIKETKELVDNFMKLSKDERYHVGFSALYCYESMIPEIAENKIDGLKKYYGAKDGEDTLKFFEVHQSADIIHRQLLKI